MERVVIRDRLGHPLRIAQTALTDVPAAAVILGPKKYVTPISVHFRELSYSRPASLFDLESDPQERFNLLEQKAESGAWMKRIAEETPSGLDVSREKAALTAEQKERLRSLGYIE